MQGAFPLADRTMRAVRHDKFGPPDVLYVAQVPIPAVTGDGVLVRVHGARIGGGQSAIRQGKVALVMGKRFPMGVGVEFAGLVEEIGPTTKGTFKPGDAVWGIMPHKTCGAIADYVCVPEARVARAPRNLSLVEAATVPASGTTVVRALTIETNLRKGERLLLRGAGGGLGSIAIPYAKSLGAEVSAVAGPRALSLMHELGADHVFDYRTSPLDTLGRFDVIMDAIGTEMGTLRRMLAPGGRMIELGFDPDHLLLTMLQIAASTVFGGRRIRAFSNNPSQADIAHVTKLTEDGVMKPIIEKVWGLENIVEAAKAAEESGMRGMQVVKLI